MLTLLATRLIEVSAKYKNDLGSCTTIARQKTYRWQMFISVDTLFSDAPNYNASCGELCSKQSLSTPGFFGKLRLGSDIGVTSV